MVGKVEIHEVIMLTPIAVTFTDYYSSYSGQVTDLFYFDYQAGNVIFAANPDKSVPNDVKRAIIDYVSVRTPPIVVPPMPERPSHDTDSFAAKRNF